MPTKIRKQIYLDKQQNQRLKHLAAARGMSEAQVIRGLIDAQAGAAAAPALPPDPAAWEAILHFIWQRSRSGVTGTPYQWNREAIYEERAGHLGHRVNDGADSQTWPGDTPPPPPGGKTRRPKTPRRPAASRGQPK